MVTTSHGMAVRTAVRDILGNDPESVAALHGILARMRRGDYDRHHLQCIVQKSRHSPSYNLEDAYAFGHVNADCRRGRIGMARIDVSHSPFSDCDADDNQYLLSRLPPPFRGEFYGGHGDDDGVLEWAEPIRVSRNTAMPSGETLVQSVTIQPRSVPLEVGTTAGSRSLLHMRHNYALARWPYGHEFIGLYLWLTDDEIATAEFLQ